MTPQEKVMMVQQAVQVLIAHSQRQLTTDQAAEMLKFLDFKVEVK